ncbi:distal tail protein Dit [Lacticaseibacillus rhamnosus]|uniref:distal tail protein Dit n=1 Tax=Lacticaseibacillus rhamnosus TaxID=47715 RepID=UPI001BAA1769|nr:distal tail protein Dit [Lacticaseibacillus rhamnosus]QUH17697.1 phage tail family protein [Lacticaseibacillus rhamnosus]QUS96629.1 phage tail family protein [Lacticaseibacillus rhamnosus]
MYDFRETTPFTGSDDNQRPAEAMLIDGQYIEDLIPGYSTLQVSGRELLSQSIEKQTIGKSDGEFIQYVRNPSREIIVGYRLSAADNLSFRQAFYKLNDILHGDTHQVSFNDDLSVYWNAVLTDVDDVPKGRNAITSSFTLFVPDGIAHSVATQTFDNMPYKDIPLNLMAGTSADPVSVTGSGWNIQKLGSFNNPTVGKKYAATVLLGRADFAVSFQLWANDINGNRISLAGFPVTTQMGANQRSTIVCTWPDPGTTGAAQIEVTLAWAFQKTDVGTYQYLKAKLEEGTTYSTWSPNPADPEYYSDTITVHNGGTYPVDPVITATMHGDNGVVAFVNDQGSVLQFGSPSEIDGVVRQKSERVYYFDFENEPKGIVMNDGALTYPNYRDNPSTPNKQKGIFSYGRPDGYDNAIAYPNTERNPSNYWSGPSMSGKLAANSNGKQNGNFEWRNLIRFATMTNWAGRVEFNLTYEGKIVASLALYDQSTTDDQVMFEGKIHDGNDARMLFHEALPRDLYSRANSFAVISKMGDQLTFRIDRVGGGNVIRPFTIAGFGALPVDGWTVWFSAFSDVLEANMGWQDSYFDWVNVDYWTDVPNRFKEGDVVKIDVAKRVVSLNGAEDPTLQTVGNNWEGFQLLPGNNTIQVLQSDWAEPYTCQVEWQEAWL